MTVIKFVLHVANDSKHDSNVTGGNEVNRSVFCLRFWSRIFSQKDYLRNVSTKILWFIKKKKKRNSKITEITTFDLVCINVWNLQCTIFRYGGRKEVKWGWGMYSALKDTAWETYHSALSGLRRSRESRRNNTVRSVCLTLHLIWIHPSFVSHSERSTRGSEEAQPGRQAGGRYRNRDASG